MYTAASMDVKTLQEQYPGYTARREITITYLVSSKGAPIYVVEDKSKNEELEEESTSREFIDTSLEEVVKEYFLTPSK